MWITGSEFMWGIKVAKPGQKPYLMRSLLGGHLVRKTEEEILEVIGNDHPHSKAVKVKQIVTGVDAYGRDKTKLVECD